MELRSAVALLVVLAAVASSLVMLLEHPRPPPPAKSKGDKEPFGVFAFHGKGNDRAKLAMMKHDLSLTGFANRTGHWHVFPGNEHLFPGNEHLFPGSTPLPFGNSYRDLIGGLANLPNLPVGRPGTMRATGALSGYTPAVADDDDALDAVKRGLATMTVMTSEAQRLQPIRDLLANGWDSSDVHVATEHLPYIEHWDTICYEILRAEKNNGVWDGPFTDLLRVHANIKSKEEALAVVGAITNTTLSDLMVAHARRA